MALNPSVVPSCGLDKQNLVTKHGKHGGSSLRNVTLTMIATDTPSDPTYYSVPPLDDGCLPTAIYKHDNTTSIPLLTSSTHDKDPFIQHLGPPKSPVHNYTCDKLEQPHTFHNTPTQYRSHPQVTMTSGSTDATLNMTINPSKEPPSAASMITSHHYPTGNLNCWPPSHSTIYLPTSRCPYFITPLSLQLTVAKNQGKEALGGS